jgi:hypothetical protein
MTLPAVFRQLALPNSRKTATPKHRIGDKYPLKTDARVRFGFPNASSRNRYFSAIRL